MDEFQKVHEEMSHALRETERRGKERKVVRETDILCDRCGEANFVVEAPGSETPEWLVCPKCGQYHYFIVRTHCANWVTPFATTDEYEKRLRSVLGVP